MNACGLPGPACPTSGSSSSALPKLIAGKKWSGKMQVAQLSPDQNIVTVTRNILTDQAFALSYDHTILDFGCGSGRHVFEFRDAGFIAFGYDTANSLILREPAEIACFRFSPDEGNSRIPFNDNTFDLVYSTSVFEHVMDYDAALSEISRVLRPGGASLHYFPSRYRPIEPHTFVPFAGIFQSYRYFLLWAALGIRNSFQRGKPFREVARLNLEYAKTALCYLQKAKILALARPYFNVVKFVEEIYLKHAPGRSRYLCPLVKVFPAFQYLYAAFHTRVLLLRK